ncbi:unnamed protein product [Trichogramma brassicae]|uniref:Uncharacterized protein n=1 Tax=Trichogramma brassicae TaxID=86971 RepID=A0A6H5I3C2_9HYME|nr:unnamed protein product [Trichogramma brassicae]
MCWSAPGLLRGVRVPAMARACVKDGGDGKAKEKKLDFVGGDDFGTAGHTPLHPMYVSYSALSPPKLSTFVGTGGSGAGNTSTTGSNNRDRESYYYPTNTATTTTSDSHRSTSAATLADPTTFVTTTQQPPHQQQHHHQKQASKLSALSALSAHSAHSYRQSPASTPVSSQRRVMHASPLATTAAAAQVDYDYSNPIDQLPSYRNREDYDTLNPPVAHNSGSRRMYQRAGGNSARAGPAPPMPPYSPLMGYRQQQQQQQSHLNRTQLSPNGIRNSRNSIRPRMKKKTQNPIRPIYSIEYSQPEPPSHVNHEDRMSPKPMTPRRVKRRSVISRDQGMRRSSRRSSVRQSRRKSQSSNRMSDQDGLYANSSNFANQNMNSISQGQLNYDRISGRWERVDRNSISEYLILFAINLHRYRKLFVNLKKSIVSVTVNPGWQGSNMNMNMNMNMNLAAASSSPNIWQPTTPVYPSMPSIPVPNSWENASSTRNLTDNMAVSMNPLPMHGQCQGQSNPSFQQTSIQSLNQEDMDEIYNNRPASVRSIYSNYHGVRALKGSSRSLPRVCPHWWLKKPLPINTDNTSTDAATTTTTTAPPERGKLFYMAWLRFLFSYIQITT